MAAARRPRRRVRCSARIGSRSSFGYAGKTHWSETDFELVTINGAPGLLMRHPITRDGSYSLDCADGRIRAIYVVRNPHKLRGC
jgi:RNA polymerase sigma-70 factor (ECF subfamily)